MVVFHGMSVAAKGATWAIEVARHAPQLTFVFPFKSRQLKLASAEFPPNVRFEPQTWETGLADQVSAAAIVLVPSLWSATMEVALLKSIVAARAVAVVDEPTAYSSELPAGLVLRLPADPCQAAQQLTAAATSRWSPDPQLRADWISQLECANRNLLSRLITRLQLTSRRIGPLPPAPPSWLPAAGGRSPLHCPHARVPVHRVARCPCASSFRSSIRRR